MSQPGYEPPQGPAAPNRASETGYDAAPVPLPPPDAETAPPGHPAENPRGLDEHGRPRGGKVSALWIGLIVAAVLLILLLIFIAQNSKTVPIHFFTASGHISLAVALLLSAVVAVLLVAIPGSLRILQLRRLVRRTARQHEQERS
jgi:uncharacterized integral membrane protein